MVRSQIIVTTSWDDGHVLDLKVAELLNRYGLSGTFYIAPRSTELRPRDRLRPEHVRELATSFEIGGHTLTHPRLPRIEEAQAAKEIEDGKVELEQIIGARVTSFAYPGGAYDERHVLMVRRAGFEVARTVRRFVVSAPADPFQMHTTLHGYRHWSDVAAIARHADFRPVITMRQFWNWDTLAVALFDLVYQRGGVFHLWGHSWEIARNDDWDRLERVFAHVARHLGLTHRSNGEFADPSDPKQGTEWKVGEIRSWSR
ncbi:MAG: polysaccharide deacetylase family protein [Solirubrobacteraceae bacterium]